MSDYAPGMRIIIRDEEWMVKKIETNSLGNKALYCVGISTLVKDNSKLIMYRFAPTIYEMLDTLSLEMKEELLEYLKADIVAAKAAPKKFYLEEQWAEIKRLIEKLKYEPFIDDQIGIEAIGT